MLVNNAAVQLVRPEGHKLVPGRLVASQVANQLRLRDIGGIIVIDFVDMEVAKNRDEVVKTFRAALARDKTRTQVFDISELGLVEMTRKRIGEGLLESVTEHCPACEGNGHVMVDGILD